MDKLCADIILVHDFIKLHKGVHFIIHENKSLFQFNFRVSPNRNDVCLVTAVNVDPSRILCRTQISNAGCQVQCYTSMKMSFCFSVLICTERLQAISVMFCILAVIGISLYVIGIYVIGQSLCNRYLSVIGIMQLIFIHILFNSSKLQLLVK